MSTRLQDIAYRSKMIIVTVALLAAIVLVGMVIGLRVRLADDVATRLDAVLAAGHPTSGAELNQWHAPVPDSENAALVMAEAFELMRTYSDVRSNEVNRFKAPPRGVPLTLELTKLLAGYVDLNEAAMAKTKEAMALPACRFPVDFSLGFYALLPHLGKIKTLAVIARDEALLALDAGRIDDAAASLAMMLGLARTLEAEPLMISQLVRIAVVRMAAMTLERCLNAGTLSEAGLKQLAADYSAGEKSNLMAHAYIGERALAIPYFHLSRTEISRLAKAVEEGGESPRGPLPGKEPLLFRATGFFQRDLRFYLDAMQTNIDLANLGPPRSLVATNRQTQIEAKSKYYFISRMLLPSMSRVFVREAEALAMVRVSITALAVERFRLRNGQLPKSLGELAPLDLPSVPADPFDGLQLRYRRLPKGYVVYSVGSDGQDDGGREPPIKRDRTAPKTADLTLTVEQ